MSEISKQDLIDLLENASHTIALLLDGHEDVISADNAKEIAKKEVKNIDDMLNKWHAEVEK